MLLKLNTTNTDYAIPFTYVKVLKADYSLESQSLLITYECGNLDDSGMFQKSRDAESLHCEPDTVKESFGKISPEVDAYNILMARAGYKGEVV
jgi:hypothetical protein